MSDQPPQKTSTFSLRYVFLFSFILVPAQIIRVMFVMGGLEGDPLIAALIVLGIGVVAHSILKVSPLRKLYVYWACAYLTGILAILAGLLALFTFDTNNVPTIVILSSLLLSSYYTAQLDLSLFPATSLEIQETQSSSAHVVQTCRRWGGLIFLGALFLLQWILPLVMEMPIYLDVETDPFADATLLFVLGVFYLLLPLLRGTRILSEGDELLRQESVREEGEVQHTSPGRQTHGLLLGLVLILALLIAFFIYSVFVVAPAWNFLVYLGLAVGVVIAAWVGIITPRRTTLVVPTTIILTGLAYNFALDPASVQHGLFLFALGVALGWAIHIFRGEVQGLASASPRATHAWTFLLLLIVVGAGFIAGQLRWLVRDTSEYLPLTANLVALLMLVIGVLGYLMKAKVTRPVRASRHIHIDRVGKWETRKILAVCSLIFLVVCPLLMGLLYSRSRASVTVTLPQTMYTVDGTPVTQVTLAARTGKVLLYNNPKTATPAGQAVTGAEIIRPGKTIRLGAYFYGGTEGLLASEAVDWIGHNMDVFSLGGWPAGFVTPDDIDTIRATNPDVRYYIMTFATSFGEVLENTDCGCLAKPWSWGCVFNDTMNEWTLKYKNGTEAYGVRRGPGDKYGHLMDLGSEGWAKFYAWFYSFQVEQAHADGVAIDEVMWRGYWGTQVDQLRDYATVEEITASCYEWLRIVNEQMDCEVITQAFWPDAQQYQQGVWGELSFRCGGAYGGRADDRQQNVFYESMNWEKIVDNMYSVAAAGKSYIWAAWYDRDDPDALEYAISTYLMGKPNDCTHLGFHPQPIYDGGYPTNLAGYDFRTVRQEVTDHPEFFDLEMGRALGNMTSIQGVGGSAWQRNFEKGIVLVNPYHAQVPGFQENNPVFAPSH